MGEIYIISESEVRQCLTMSMAIRGVEDAYVQKVSGKGEIFPLVCHDFVKGRADMDIKSGEAKSSGIFGLKVVSWFGDNTSKGLPALNGTILLMDNTTGEPMALLNAAGITGMRTGAAGAVGVKYLAREDSRTMLMVGTGAQAPYQIAAVLTARAAVDTVYLCDPMDARGGEKRLAEVEAAVDDIISRETRSNSYKICPAESLEAAVRRSDIIITATPSRTPMIFADWVRPGTHFSCMGADMHGKQELDPRLLARARVFVDDLRQAVSVGECELAVSQGILKEADIAGELGAVIDGTASGRTSWDSVTVFDSSGIALQDLIVAKEIVEAAKAMGLGRLVEL